MLSSEFVKHYPTLAQFSTAYIRRSKLGKIYTVRRRTGNSLSRMHERRRMLKNAISTMSNTGRIAQNPNLFKLELNKISNRGQRKAYGKLIKQLSKGVRKIV